MECKREDRDKFEMIDQRDLSKKLIESGIVREMVREERNAGWYWNGCLNQQK